MAKYTKSWDYATFQAYLDGEKVGEPYDAWSPQIVPSGRIDLGTHDLTAGPHKLKFVMVGKNENSSGYFFGLDAIQLTPG